MLSVAQLPDKYHSPQYGQVFAAGNRITVRVHACNHCGHLALFQFADSETPDGWKGEE